MPDLMEDFFHKITYNKQTNNKQIETYISLIFNGYSFFINESFPLYSKEIQKDTLDKYIKQFIKDSTPSRPYPKCLIEDFVNFIKINKLEKRKFALELINFELQNIKIFDLPYEVKSHKFSWHKRYKASINTKLLNNSYESHTNPKNKKPSYLILYKTLSYDTYHIETTKFIFDLIKLKNNDPIIKNVSFLCKRYKIDFKETKNVVEDILKFYCQNGIISLSFVG